MRVQWSIAALDDFDHAIAFIAARNPPAADRVTKAIDRAARELGRFQTGRSGRVSGTYEKPLPGLPYIIAYAIDRSDTVTILRVIHGARDWPPGR
ncbi:MAG TPA: type II toxin-antitoxin system RelE/ParE family toxin [Pseudolabrys sp.]|nr:type II toxin-antitoxin system RelE/ParE family toxin [Pseudolabrys sp.]